MLFAISQVVHQVIVFLFLDDTVTTSVPIENLRVAQFVKIWFGKPPRKPPDPVLDLSPFTVPCFAHRFCFDHAPRPMRMISEEPSRLISSCDNQSWGVTSFDVCHPQEVPATCVGSPSCITLNAQFVTPKAQLCSCPQNGQLKCCFCTSNLPVKWKWHSGRHMQQNKPF